MADSTRTAKPIVIAIDQGTSSTKALALDRSGVVIASVKVEVTQSHPAPGWVEQDALEILESVLTAMSKLYAELEPQLSRGAIEVRCIGLSTQRESAVAWDRKTGQPVGPVLGWQDRRTASRSRELIEAGMDARVRRITGLPIDPMFSALKFEWLLDSVDADRSRSERGEIAVGTVDSWLVYALTGEHRIEAGNASRTQLLDLDAVEWSDELCRLFRVPASVLPRVATSIEPSSPFRPADGAAPVHIAAILGDSHAALYGHGVRGPGRVKATYGTGSSIMGLTTAEIPPGLVRTLAWFDDQPRYAYEGNILSSGSTLVWLAELLGSTPAHLLEQARAVEPARGLDLVPAFAGLGAPWWDGDATALITGLTLATTAAQLSRAAVESVVLQIEDVLQAADRANGGLGLEVMADGGPSANDWLMQLQADLSQRTVHRSAVAELSAVGVAHLAGEASGIWSPDHVAGLTRTDDPFIPHLSGEDAALRRSTWNQAVAKARSTESSPEH